MRLVPPLLAGLPASLQRPGYDRERLSCGIVHLGIGAFARAHLAWATDAALGTGDDPRWGIAGVSLRQPAARDALAPQHGLYTLLLRDADAAGRVRERLQLIGCLREVLYAGDDAGAVLEHIAAPATRIVSLTVTEKGYCRDAAGALDPRHPDVQQDLHDAARPASAIGFAVRGLALRRARRLGGVTLLSLDNLAANGDTLRRLLLALAARIDPALADWIAAECSFPNSMVDRIVPRCTDADRAAVAAAIGVHDAAAVVAEPFFDWVVEDRFVAGRPDWAAAGVRFVADAAPWEQLKLRMVNGTHSAIAYLGVLAGWGTVHEALAQPLLARYVQRLLRDEIAPTLPPLPGLDLDARRDALLRRLANPALAHRTLQIAADGSQKLPQRWLPVLRERCAAGLPSPLLALALAAWIEHLRGSDEAGRGFVLDDPLAAALQAHRGAAQSADAEAEAMHWLRFATVFGDAAALPGLAPALAAALARLRAGGVAAALA